LRSGERIGDIHLDLTAQVRALETAGAHVTG
jgi:hypothetical protein